MRPCLGGKKKSSPRSLHHSLWCNHFYSPCPTVRTVPELEGSLRTQGCTGGCEIHRPEPCCLGRERWHLPGNGADGAERWFFAQEGGRWQSQAALATLHSLRFSNREPWGSVPTRPAPSASSTRHSGLSGLSYRADWPSVLIFQHKAVPTANIY